MNFDLFEQSENLSGEIPPKARDFLLELQALNREYEVSLGGPACALVFNNDLSEQVHDHVRITLISPSLISVWRGTETTEFNP